MNKKESRLHLRLYITIIFCVVIAIVITSTILHVNFQSILMKHEYHAKLEKMESQAAQVSKMSDIALSTLFQIYNDISVRKLLTYQDIDAIDENTAFIQLRYYLATIPNVDSIYVYNVNNNRIYNVSNEKRLVRPWNADYYKKDSDFFDQSAVTMIDGYKEYLPYIPYPRYYEVREGEVKCVYTYMMYNIFISNESNVVMLNLESQYLFQDTVNDGLASVSLVIDQNDTVVYSDSDLFQVLDQLPAAFDPDGRMDKDESGYFLTRINGTRSVIIYTGADSRHWRYISVIAYDVLLSQVRSLQTITVIISLFITGVGGAIAHIFSRRLAVPIRTMSMDIKSLQNEKRQADILTKNIRLLELLNNSGIDRKGVKTSEINDGRIGCEADTGGKHSSGADILSLAGMASTAGSKYILLCLSVDGYQSLSETDNTKDLRIYKFAACNILGELMGDGAKAYSLEMSIDKNLAILQVNSGMTREMLEDHIKKMQFHMKEYFQISISIVSGAPEEDPERLFYLYENIKEAAARNIFRREGSAAFVPEAGVKPVHEYNYPEQKEKRLAESLMLGKAREAQMQFDEIITETRQYPIVIYNMVINRLIFTIDNLVSLMKKNGASAAAGFTGLSNLLQEADTLEKRNNKFYELFYQIEKEIERRKSEKHELVITKINDIIDRELCNPSFSLDTLAEAVGMSVAYMCRLYRQYTGNTIIELVVSKRMEKARQLLSDTELPVNEIAELVGYTNSTYFYRVFKKTNGITPNEFRKK